MTDRELMQQVLEALESCCPGDYTTGHVIHPSYDERAVTAAITALRERLAQPDQKPMARAWDEGYRQGVEDECISAANIGIAGFGAKVKPARQNPYGITPPQRKPLTHPQIHEFDWPDGVSFEDILLFVRAIEAAHDIKGQE